MRPRKGGRLARAERVLGWCDYAIEVGIYATALCVVIWACAQ